MRRLTWSVGLGLLVAVGTAGLGWWTVPIVGLGAGWLGRRRKDIALLTALGAGLAWGGLLAGLAWHAPLGPLLGRLAMLFALPAAGVVGLTVLFPMLLAWSAATLARRIGQWTMPAASQS